jgi:hypothetical protein
MFIAGIMPPDRLSKIEWFGRKYHRNPAKLVLKNEPVETLKPLSRRDRRF